MAALWKNSPYLSWWGRQYAEPAPWSEECYPDHACFAAQFKGSRQYGITCTALSGATPCGWDDFTAAGQWVGEASTPKTVTSAVPGRSAKGPIVRHLLPHACSPSRTVNAASDSM